MLFNRKFRTGKVFKNHGITPVTNWNDNTSVNLKISNRNGPIKEKMNKILGTHEIISKA